MSKAGLETLTKYAAPEMVSPNIRINSISVCSVDTNSLRYVKVFLASKRSTRITGQISTF